MPCRKICRYWRSSRLPAHRPKNQNVMITGRVMPAELEEVADTISSIRDERHAFRLGVKAQVGIEY